MPQLHLTLLGAFRVRRADGREVSIPARKTRALLAFLALPAGRLHERDRLAELLWGDSDDARARHSLRQALSLLRRALPDALILGDRIGLAAGAIEVDAMAFDRLAGGHDAASLDGAMQLYAGDLLDGFHPPSEPFADWHRGERERLRERALQALDLRLAQLHRGGAVAPAIAAALRLLELDPLREPAHRALMRLYQQQGRAAAALQQYQRLIELLRRELGTEPEADTRLLYEQLLLRTRQRVAAPPAATAPESDGAARTNPPLLGRDAELVKLDALGAAARGGRGRAVAVLGEAGGGKTRMLGELAERWRDAGGRVLRGGCREIQARVPLHLWATALSSLSGIEQDRVLGNGTAARRRIAALFGDSGRATGDPDTSTAANRDALFAAVAELVSRLAAERPLLLCLDDLQWADSGSLDLLQRVIRGCAGSAILIALTIRDEEIVDAPHLDALLHALTRDGLLDRLPLRPLTREHVGRLARDLSGAATTPARLEHLAALAWRASEGNPLLAIEATRDTLRPRRGAAKQDDLPARARHLVETRLSRLSPPACAWCRRPR